MAVNSNFKSSNMQPWSQRETAMFSSPAAANTQDQILVKALQDFIVPLIHAAVDVKRRNYAQQQLLSPEALKVVRALKGFVLNIVESSTPEAGTKIEVGLDKEENTMDVDIGGSQGEVSMSSRADLSGNSRNPTNSESSEINQPSFHDKVLQELRNRVFNRMPIRLLCIEPQGSSIQISLAERGSIYTHLASLLQRKMYDEEYGPQFNELWGIMETDTEAITRLLWKYAGYAILSHTWLRASSGEVTYCDWNKGKFNTEDPGYQKLVNFCRTAWKDYGLTLAWMDTICIDKDSSAELDESIRSMYNWYHRSKVCIIYLAETETLADMCFDRWFTRGWTLQELLAPRVIKFYNSDWERFVEDSDNDKRNCEEITDQIEKVTTISKEELDDDIHDAPISRRMQLAANREVTREEDVAYSLMGIFSVSITTAYGEGSERAFFRLLQEILNSTSTGVLDLFNWAGELPQYSSPTSRILPTNPHYYLCRSSSISLRSVQPFEPLTLTHMGLRIPVLLMPGVSADDRGWRYKTIGNYGAIVNISPAGIYSNIPSTYHLLDSRVSGSDGFQYPVGYQSTFAVFNFTEGTPGIFIPRTCTAIALECSHSAGSRQSIGRFDRIETNSPIVFEMEERNMVSQNEFSDNYMMSVSNGILVLQEDLPKHGIQLISMYL